MKPAKLRGHGTEVCAWRSPIQGSPEAARSMGAKLHVGIHRKGYGIEGGCVGHRLGQPELMRDAIDIPDSMPPVRRVSQVETGQMRQRHNGFGRPFAMLHRGQENRVWL